MLYRQAAESLARAKIYRKWNIMSARSAATPMNGPMEGRCPVCNTPGEKFEKIA